MNIIICGAGRVGFTIAKLLSEQNHSITVVDQSSEDIQKIKDTLDVVHDHPRLPLILRHNEFVRNTFLTVRARYFGQ